MTSPTPAHAALQSFLSLGYSQYLPGAQQIDPTPTTTRTPNWTPPDNPRKGPMPPIDMITYATIGVFDNGSKPDTYVDPETDKTRKRQKANRFKVSIDAWTQPAHLIQKYKGGQFSRKIWVKNTEEFLKLVSKNYDAMSFSDEQALRMTELAMEDQNALHGVMSDRDNGFTYFPDQVIQMHWDEFGMPVVTFYVGTKVMKTTRMTAEFLTDAQRASGLIAQEYLDRCEYAAYWKKNNLLNSTKTRSKTKI